jgi:hypothetical protein
VRSTRLLGQNKKSNQGLLNHESLADLVKDMRNGKRVPQFAEDFILLKKIKTQMGLN